MEKIFVRQFQHRCKRHDKGVSSIFGGSTRAPASGWRGPISWVCERQGEHDDDPVQERAFKPKKTFLVVVVIISDDSHFVTRRR